MPYPFSNRDSLSVTENLIKSTFLLGIRIFPESAFDFAPGIVLSLSPEKVEPLLLKVAEKEPWSIPRILKDIPEPQRAGIITDKLLLKAAEKYNNNISSILKTVPEPQRAGLITDKLLVKVADRNPESISSILKTVPEPQRAGLITDKLLLEAAEKCRVSAADILGTVPEPQRISLITDKLLLKAAEKVPESIGYILDAVPKPQRAGFITDKLLLKLSAGREKSSSEEPENISERPKNILEGPESIPGILAVLPKKECADKLKEGLSSVILTNLLLGPENQVSDSNIKNTKKIFSYLPEGSNAHIASLLAQEGGALETALMAQENLRLKEPGNEGVEDYVGKILKMFPAPGGGIDPKVIGVIKESGNELLKELPLSSSDPSQTFGSFLDEELRRRGAAVTPQITRTP